MKQNHVAFLVVSVILEYKVSQASHYDVPKWRLHILKITTDFVKEIAHYPKYLNSNLKFKLYETCSSDNCSAANNLH